jgi:XTP/dITP diphosphohydrolase
MDPVMSIVVATTNRGKLSEIRALLAHLPVEVLSMTEALGVTPTIIEDGTTFEDNALIKARYVASRCKSITLADDSGLEVDALGGNPGVRSARFAGERASDAENNAELLRQLDDVAMEDRSARFRCVIALVDPWKSDDEHLVVEGSCEGQIAHKPTGTGGFGYDPLFIVQPGQSTMAELTKENKNKISHRARALTAMTPKLAALIEERVAEAAKMISENES